MSPLDDRLLRDKDVARMYDVTERTVRKWRQQGAIPTVYTPSGRPRTPAAALEDDPNPVPRKTLSDIGRASG